MPGWDRTGPLGKGPMTGRGLGTCLESKAVRCAAGVGIGLGLGLAVRYGLCRKLDCRLGRRFGTGLGADLASGENDALIEEKILLQERLGEIEKRLEEIDRQEEEL